MTTNKTCKHCGLTLHLKDREGDICLTCLASIRPHTTYHENTYSTIEGMIRQSTDNPIEKTNNDKTEKNTVRKDQTSSQQDS
jgi:hypothetical protein